MFAVLAADSGSGNLCLRATRSLALGLLLRCAVGHWRRVALRAHLFCLRAMAELASEHLLNSMVPCSNCGRLIFWRDSTSLPPDPAFCSTCYGLDDDDDSVVETQIHTPSGAQHDTVPTVQLATVQPATVQPAFGGNRRGSKKPAAAAQSSTIKKKPAAAPRCGFKTPATTPNLAIKKKPATLSALGGMIQKPAASPKRSVKKPASTPKLGIKKKPASICRPLAAGSSAKK